MEKNRDDSGAQKRDEVQGEGDYESARRYDRDVKKYLENADVERAARDAEPRTEAEAEELEAAEDEGRRHARGPDAPKP
ncbi:MAG: hypothetical protein JO005_09520 [Gammaproteobacteria bacterium]|nr:hypothetical protein [Gammaproteobacteria bacterium]